MRSAANSHVKMAKVSHRVPDTSVRGSRSYHAETKSKPVCSHRRGAREKSGTVIHFYFGVDLISVISVQAFFT